MLVILTMMTSASFFHVLCDLRDSDSGSIGYASTMVAAATGASTRSRALSLYRQLLRAAEKMPTPNRRNFVRKKTRTEFKANKHLADPEVRNKELNNIYSMADTTFIKASHKPLFALLGNPILSATGRHKSRHCFDTSRAFIEAYERSKLPC